MEIKMGIWQLTALQTYNSRDHTCYCSQCERKIPIHDCPLYTSKRGIKKLTYRTCPYCRNGYKVRTRPHKRTTSEQREMERDATRID